MKGNTWQSWIPDSILWIPGGGGGGGGRGGVVDMFMVGRYITFHNYSYDPVLLEPALNVLESLQVPFYKL